MPPVPWPVRAGRSLPPHRVDALLAATAGIAVQAQLALSGHPRGGVPLPEVVTGLSVLALTQRRRHPLATFLVVAAGLLVDRLLGGSLVELATTTAVVVVSAYSLGAHARTGRAVAGVVLGSGLLTLANQLGPSRSYAPADDVVWFLCVVVGPPALLGSLLASRRRAAGRLRARRDQLARQETDRSTAAAALERSRLASTLADLLEDHLATVLHAAEQAAAPDDGAALGALRDMEQAGRRALVGMREVVGSLRTGPEEDGEAVAPGPVEPARRTLLSPMAVDVVTAGLLAAAVTVEVAARADPGPWLPELVGVLIMAGVLAWRRTSPLLVLAAILAVALALTTLSIAVTSLVTTIPILVLAVYSAGAHLALRPALTGLGVVLGALPVLYVVAPAAGQDLGSLAPVGVLSGLSWAAGRAVHGATARTADLSAHVLVAEELAAARHRLAVEHERLALARELHDVVAHSMTVLVLQAGAAQRAWERQPERAREALAVAVATAREMRTELRSTLSALDPPPGLEGIAALLTRARTAGVRVTLEVSGDLSGLDAAGGRTAYRVVQEALTNAARHAAPTTARVELAVSGTELRVEVADTGRQGTAGDPVPGTGSGLLGLCERVAEAGGRLEAGPASTGGFVVRAMLPVREVVR